MKNDFIKIAETLLLKKNNVSGNKIFQLKNAKINHPRYKHEAEYLATRKWCENQHMKDIYIRSYDGLRLHGSYLPAQNPKRIILMCHGYKGSSFGSIAHMAEFLHKNDCSLILIDERCCGKSEGEYITFGAKEQYDVIAWIHWIHRKLQRKECSLPVYLYGQSMGASAVLMASAHKLPSWVKGIVADCGFHSMRQQLSEMAMHWFHIHRIEIFLSKIDFLCRILAGFKMQDAATSGALRQNKIPILFFHGKDDTYVLPINSLMNYKLCRAPKELVLIPGARHLCCSYEAPEVYKKRLMNFFDKYDV